MARLPKAPLRRTNQTSHLIGKSTFLHVLRTPDRVIAYPRLSDALPLTRCGDEWQGAGIQVETKVEPAGLPIHVHSPNLPLRYIHVRWEATVATSLSVLGDHWERSYGDLGWRNIIPERVMPWYFATYDGEACHAYGVKTGAGSFSFWQLDAEGISLWLNLSNGGSGVRLGSRTLAAATVVAHEGTPGEEPTSALHNFCGQMCSRPTPARQPIYGTNDWYYAYGNSSADQILRDTDFLAELTAANRVRPFSMTDGGWTDRSPRFPSMLELARQIRKRNARPGIWIRPLEAPLDTDRNLLLSDLRCGERQHRAKELAYDPTVPEARERILRKVKQAVDCGFDLIKHDFSTYDLLGRWGFEMGADPTAPGWNFHDRTITNAEVILGFYRSVREACAEDTLILGCNTVGHLGQGFFDIQRTGDDTSGRQWERTRRMGVNTLAFRLPQHGAFFIQDADCVGITAGVPWELNRQWLDLLARSGTALFVSPGEGSRARNRVGAIKEAFALAALGGDGARPTGYLEESTPRAWITGGSAQQSPGRELHYDWCTSSGAFPFTV